MNIYPPKSSIEFTKSLLVSCLLVHYKTPIDPWSKLQGSPSPKWNSGSSSLQRWSMAFLSLHAVFSWDPWFVSWLPNNPRLEGISALSQRSQASYIPLNVFWISGIQMTHFLLEYHQQHGKKSVSNSPQPSSWNWSSAIGHCIWWPCLVSMVWLVLVQVQ